MSKNITVIPARSRRGKNVKEEEKARVKVAAYCRVSTDSDEQATSYEAQVEHYTEYIQKNPEWEFAGIYADDGISGTNTKKRCEFNQMIEDCMAGKVDSVVTKSISRFARNTLDCLRYIRQLKDAGIPVFFEKENINTMDAKGEVLLTIMASLAQQESQSLSQNVKLGCQYRYQQGKVQVNHNKFLGYTKDENGDLVIEPEEARTIKRIFYEYLEGSSLLDIAKGLERDRILTGAHKKKWRAETIHKMLRNEKYMGDALLQKTYTVDFLTKKRVVNNGIVPQYYVEGSHEAIIPKEIFLRTQEEMYRRAHIDINGRHHVYSSRYALSSIVFCGECGSLYRRLKWNNRGKRSVVWRCVNRVEHGKEKCSSRTVKEEHIKQAVVTAVNSIFKDEEGYIKTLEESIRSVIGADHSKEIQKVESELLRVQEELLKTVKAKGSYDHLAETIDRLREEKNSIMVKDAIDAETAQRMEEMLDFIHSFRGREIGYDEQLVRKLVEKITVDKDTITVLLKSGISVTTGEGTI